MILKLVNNLSKTTATFNVTDLEDNGKFWHFNLSLNEGMKDGEYSYTLYNDDNEEIATGLCQIGDYTPTKTEYNKPNNGYIQYD